MAPLLGLLGSGEFLAWAAGVDRFLLDHATSGDGSVAIVPAASAPEGDDVFDRWAAMGLDHYSSVGAKAFVVPVKVRDDAFADEVVAMIERASLVFFSGGNPAYVSDVFRDTPAWNAIVDLLERGGAAGGCSAGACMFGDVAPDPTAVGTKDAWSKPGLSLLKGYSIGAHWDALDTFYPGLQKLALKHVPAGSTMIGIDEDTAMVADGDDWRVIGRGAVHVYADGETARSYQDGTTFTLP
jgi:cyanophycinase